MNGLALAYFADSEPASITSGVSTVTEVFGNVWTLLTGNPLCMVFVGASLLGLGIGLFRKLKRSV